MHHRYYTKYFYDSFVLFRKDIHFFLLISVIHKNDLENLENPFLLPSKVRRHSRDKDSMEPIIWAEVVKERYKIRSISLSVLNTTETNLDTSLFGVIDSSFLFSPFSDPTVPDIKVFDITLFPFARGPQQIKHLHSRPEDGTSKPTLRR